MSSNTSKGIALKGSKLMMQKLVNSFKGILDKELEDELKWFSPLKEDDYKEYSLNEKKALNFLGYSNSKNPKPFSNFWPSRQPQWDGLAIGKNKTLYLFEAKSHFSEISGLNIGSNRTENQTKNDNLKRKSIQEVASKLKCNNYTEDIWIKKYYQIANRLSFLEALKELQKDYTYFNDVKLVFLNFVNDKTLTSAPPVSNANDWKNHYNKIFKEMSIKKQILETEGVMIINVELL